ncbi:hypothetical protein HanIR_Chr11g0512861 [Helianthus annuus]|nr:hypothetical protein HanIR_Chr11g0512861 [Helianthus annuus]
MCFNPGFEPDGRERFTDSFRFPHIGGTVSRRSRSQTISPSMMGLKISVM